MRITVCVACAIMLLLGGLYMFIDTTGDDISGPDPVKRHVSYSLVVSNTESRVIPLAEVWVAGPNKQNTVQHCLSLTADQPFQVSTDTDNNQLMHFAFNNVPPHGKIIINIEADMAMLETPLPWPLDNPESHLGKEQFIETTDKRLIEVATSLDSEIRLEAIRDIYNFVTSTLEKSSYSKNEKGALYALLNKRGDCTEFMHLFIALCRINHIPARGVSGYVVTRNQRLTPDDLHDWAEVYVDGTWRIVDPFNQVFMEKEEQYLVVQIHQTRKENQSFKRWRTNAVGLKITMVD